MLRITFIRHAKSSWDDETLSDEKRPLNSRGKNDAPLMGKLLVKNNQVPELLISSTAKRAFSTAKKIANELDYPKENIRKEKQLYLAEIGDFLEVIHKIDLHFSHISIFSHNPGITDVVNFLAGEHIYNIPTCGVATITFNVDSWNNIGENSGTLIYHDFPKNHY